MNLKHCSGLAFALIFLGFVTSSQAQTGKTANHPFAWKVTTDNWYKSPSYAFKYMPSDFTAKGGQGQATTKAAAGHGPVGSNDCSQSTAPSACTEALVKERFKDIELPGVRIPSGYSGVEYVTFEVQTNGKVNTYQVVKQSVVCPPCVQQAVNLVASIDQWHPAIQDGVVVKSEVVVPVYFKK